jgi:hypothetical protein
MEEEERTEASTSIGEILSRNLSPEARQGGA